MLNLLRFVRLPVFLGLLIGLVIILSNQQWTNPNGRFLCRCRSHGIARGGQHLHAHNG